MVERQSDVLEGQNPMQVRMRTALRCVLPLAVFVVLPPAFSAAQTPVARSSAPAQSVRDFCRMDFDGVRLTSKHTSAAAFSGLITGAGEFPEEPIRIVAAFHVVSVTEHQDAAIVRVAYRLAGRLEGALETDGLALERSSEHVDFSMLRADGFWKVKVFDFPPHVSARALRDHIRDVLEDDQRHGDNHRRDLLQRMMTKLETAGPH